MYDFPPLKKNLELFFFACLSGYADGFGVFIQCHDWCDVTRTRRRWKVCWRLTNRCRKDDFPVMERQNETGTQKSTQELVSQRRYVAVKLERYIIIPTCCCCCCCCCYGLLVVATWCFYSLLTALCTTVLWNSRKIQSERERQRWR